MLRAGGGRFLKAGGGGTGGGNLGLTSRVYHPVGVAPAVRGTPAPENLAMKNAKNAVKNSRRALVCLCALAAAALAGAGLGGCSIELGHFDHHHGGHHGGGHCR